MHSMIYIYRLKRDRLDSFLDIQRQAAAIYKEHGALDDETLQAVDLTPRYGCAGFADAFSAADDETICVGLARYRDRAHHDEVMARVNADPRIDTLFAEVTDVIDLAHVVLGEFERVV